MKIASKYLSVCAFAFAFSLNSAWGAPGRLSLVLDENNAPYSLHGPPASGLELDVARLIATQMDAELDIQWTDTVKHGLLSFLVEDQDPVQLAVGVPVEAKTVEDEELVGDKVLFSVPYASTRYVLVSRKSFADLPNFKAVGREYVGVERGSVASSRLWDEGFLLEGMASQERLLRAVAAGEIPYAVLWSNAGWQIERNAQLSEVLKVQPAEPGINGLTWNLSVAVSPMHDHLMPEINTAIRSLRDAGAFRLLFSRYGIPFFEPLDTKEP